MLAPLLNTLLIALWVGWVAQAVLSAMQVRKYARRLERPRRADFDAYRPRAAVIVPFKGLEAALAGNLHGLCTQAYPDYRLVLVVESEDDPAYPLLTEAAAKYPERQVAVLVAGRAAPDVGQKVHNQLAALAHLEREAGGEQVLVFADSDAVPGPEWLGNLVGPLGQEITGVTTGYRWLVPESGDEGGGGDSSRREAEGDAGRGAGGEATVWARLASVMNASVACFAGRESFNQAWGGSMALRVDTAREGNLVGSLRGSITDDYPLSQLSRRLGKRVYFVPRCLVASPVNFTFGELVNFAHRQYLITRTYEPGLYAAGVLLPLLYLLGFGTAWAVLLAGLVDAGPAGMGAGEWQWLAAAAAAVTVHVANHFRASYRARAVRTAFGPAMVRRLRSTLRLDRWATVVWMALHWLLIVRAGLGRTMRWRGIRYVVRGPQDVQRLG